jgi:hypothetical protein
VAHTGASIGLLAKTGRAIAIALIGPAKSPRVIERRELLLSSERIPSTVGPYHAVMELPWPAATAAVQAVVGDIERLAAESLRRFLADLAASGAEVRSAGIVGSMGRDPARIGNPHIRAHAAEGQLFREVLETAVSGAGLSHLSFSNRDVHTRAAPLLALSADSLEARLQALGKGVVRPWRSEERFAACAAWAALVSAGHQRK